MKKVISIIFIIIILLSSIKIISYAVTTPTVTLNSSVAGKLDLGDTFTISVNVSSADGINGFMANISYESEKLEYLGITMSDTNKWKDLGSGNEIAILCNSTNKITEAVVCTLEFRVKENIQDTQTTVTLTNIAVDTDAQENSRHTIPNKPVSVTIEKEIQVSSTKYNIVNNNIIKGIQARTTAQIVKTSMISNTTNIKILANNVEVGYNNFVKTGMTMNFDNKKVFTLVVAGDSTKDGEANMEDIMQINKYRLKKITLDSAAFLAADVNQDNSVNIYDIMQINKFRLGKVSSL